ncbi:MAG TPA: lipid II flippase MurJ, partial [Chloroflexota bacterium]|nr:lipid II flippase MurJ [Chloroflexota bacterium]
MTQRRHIVTAATLLLLGNLLSRILGLFREQVIASLFSISVVTSSFQTATAVPTMFYDLLVGGAVSAALIPVLSGYSDDPDRAELGRIVGTLLTGAFLLLALLVAVLVTAAWPLASMLGATSDPVAAPLTVGFLKLVIPSLLFLGLSGVTAAVCYARRWTAIPAFAIALYNGGMVATMLLLHRALGPTSMAIGVMVGAFLQCVAVAPGLVGIPIRLGIDLGHPAVRRILRLYAPVAAGLVVTEVGVAIDRNLAWATGQDSVAIMRYATFLIQLPLGLVATAASLAVLPILSRLVDDGPGFRHTLSLGLRLALLAIVPAGAFLLAFREPVIRLLFQHGAFDASATGLTASAFVLYAPQLPFVAIDQLLVYAFYARKNTVTPMLVGLGGVCVYL